MKAVVHIGGHDHHQQWCGAMARGLEKHGITVTIADPNDPRPCDFAVVWGWGRKRDAVIKTAPHVLVLERGHVGERERMTSCGWDGLGRRGRYPVVDDGGRRWQRYAHLMQPWQWRAGYALILGQVQGDAAVQGLQVLLWAEHVARQLQARGIEARYRPHPLGQDRSAPPSAPRVGGSLAEALAQAALCITYNSTAGVEAVLAGVPTVTLDEGAMAWPVAAHTLDGMVRRPDRQAWAHALAWSQWSETEIERGDAWASLAPVMAA